MAEEQGLSASKLRVMVQLRCAGAGSVAKWAQANGLCDEQVRLFLRDKRPAEPALLDALGMERVITYRPRSEGLQPPVGEIGGGSGAQKRPSRGSPTDCQTSGGEA